MTNQLTCRSCGKDLTEKEVSSRGYNYVRCRPCTVKMLKGAKAAFLLTGDGRVVKL